MHAIVSDAISSPVDSFLPENYSKKILGRCRSIKSLSLEVVERFAIRMAELHVKNGILERKGGGGGGGLTILEFGGQLGEERAVISEGSV